MGPETQTMLGVLLRKEYKTADLKLGKDSLRVLPPVRDLKLELYFLHSKFTCSRVKAGEDRKYSCLCAPVDGSFLQERPSRESTATQEVSMQLREAKATQATLQTPTRNTFNSRAKPALSWKMYEKENHGH